jgi:hypothetical protein
VTCEQFVPSNMVKMPDGFIRFTVNFSLCLVCCCAVSNLATHSTVVAMFIVWSVLGTVAVGDIIRHFC